MATTDPDELVAGPTPAAPQASVRSLQFRRMVAYVWPHRKFVTVGVMAAAVAALLNAVSIGTVGPALNILLQPSGLHGWVDQRVAEHRIGIRHLDRVLVSDSVTEPVDAWLRHVAVAPAGTKIRFRTRDAVAAELEHTIALPAPSFVWRTVRALASLVPRDVDRLTTLIYVLVFVIAVVLIGNVARFFAEYYVAIGVYRGLMHLRRDLYAKILTLPMSFFTQGTADVVSRFVQDAQEIQRGLVVLFGKFVREPMRALAILTVALYLDWRITFTMLLVAPVAVVIFMRVGHSIRKANLRLLRVYGTMIDALTATLHAIRVVKAYTSETAERKRLWRIDEQAFRQQLRITALQAFLRPMLEVLAVLTVAAATVWLGKQMIDQRLRPADFGGLVVALAMLFDPLRKLADVYSRISRAAAGAERVFAVMDMPAEAEVRDGAVALPDLAEKIEFRNVRFTYPQAEWPALDDVSLTVHKGEAVAVVGPNGSGKTTLVSLLPRFFDPDRGAVLLDGVDLKTATLKSLRRQISLVTQDAVIFEATLADNISYGAPDAPRERIVAAARRAFADEFIRGTNGGYDTVAGERGSTLSGGQKQRIAIARAVLRDAPVFIFDEATSQIDTESEHKIQQTLAEFARGRTTFIVAHRLSTIRFADRIVVMDCGRILDTGTHDELLSRCQLYATLCRTQLVE